MSKTRMVVFRGYSCHEMQKAERRMLSGNSSEKRVSSGLENQMVHGALEKRECCWR